MIKSQSNLVGEYTYICRLDDALDAEAEDFDLRWQQYLDGAADAPIKPGAKPTIFRLRHLRAGDVDYLLRKGGSSFLAAKLAVVAIDGAPIDGFALKLVEEDGRKVANLDDAPASLFIALADVGGRVIARSSPSPK
jgi:hypothetical protein